MNKNKAIKKVSNRHISAARSDETMRQIKLRIELLNTFLKDGVSEGFEAHKSQSAFLAYSDGNEITPRTRPAIVVKYCPVGEIDSKHQQDPTCVVNCLQYIELKRKQVIEMQMARETSAENTDNNKFKNINTSKSITKTELKKIINEQTQLIKSLAQELVMQRSASHKLIDLIKAVDDHHQLTLKPYYANHQNDLLKHREKSSADLNDMISTLKSISVQLDELGSMKNDNILPMRAK
tara:strand:+ start:2314 stop:3024 length:711 start_codon:yes stop_codon:yes gene_type:complete